MKQKQVWTISLSLMLAIVLSACGQKGIENPYNWTVQDFTYTNQAGEQTGLKDLKGKVWIADFIFTSCEDVCLPMTFNMSKLQDKAKEEGIEDLQFVSFSVDPAVDTPETLKAYGDNFEADYANWSFLTGYGQQEIEDFAKESFKTLVVKPKSDDQVIHGTEFYLISQEGKVLKSYTGLKDIPYDEIIKDIKSIQ
jgi:protein SCO1